MKVELDGKIQVVPPCTCGKCIVRRLRKDHFLSYPYNKNIKSIYKNDYPEYDLLNPLNDKANLYNKAKGAPGFDSVYKDHIPTSLLSTYKKDYLPFKVDFEPTIPQKVEIDKAPFFSNTTYNTYYNNWGSTLEDKIPLEKLPDIKVPLRGQSNYKESYPRFPVDNYLPNNTQIIPKSNLKFHGKINPDTTYGTSFQPVDFNQPHYFNKDGKGNKQNSEKTSFIPADYPASNFESSYNGTIGNYDKSNICKLREFLRKRGKTYLEI